MIDEPLILLAINRLSFLSTREKLALLRVAAVPGDLLGLSRGAVRRIVGRRFAEEWRPAACLEQAEDDRRNLTAGSIGCIFYLDERYPPQLREIYDSPFLLFVRGVVPDHGVPCVAVVGTRNPTSRARSASYRLGMELAAQGLAVVSGLARGIDAESHEGCLAAGGKAVAVLGNGLDAVYPPSSRRLARSILAAAGCLLGELPAGTPPSRYSFPARNRIISGLCRSVVVVQAPRRSGALITADYALEQGRDLFVHEAGLEGVAGRGGRGLREEGAPVIAGAGDILRDWKGEPRRQPEPIDAGIPGRKQPGGRRLAELMELELAGELRFHNGGYYRSAER